MHISMFRNREQARDSVIVFISSTTYERIIKAPSATVISDEILDEIELNVIEKDDVMLILNGATVRRVMSKRRATYKEELFHEIRESCVFTIEHACGTELKNEEAAARIMSSSARWKAYKNARGM